MRNLKKFLALVLATLMVVSAAATVSAFDDVAEDNQYAAAIEKLVEYGITNGVDESNFAPDNDVERYQMALFMARALKPGETDWSNGIKVFEDVEEYAGAIAFVRSKGIVTGIDNTHFAPHMGIRYQDALIMALRALDYPVDVSGDIYWLAAYQKAEEIGLTENVAVYEGDKVLTRAETAQIIYNMLTKKPYGSDITLEEKNFGVAGVNNSTTIIVTATEKQQYDKAAKPVRSDYVGTQLIANGVPTGDVKYYPAALLGIESDKIEDSFAHTYDLVNYDAETDTFDKVVPGIDPVVVSGKDIAVSGDKITVNNVPYYPVDEITGSKIKNEIVVYTGDSVAATSATIVVNKDGYVIGRDGEATTAQAVAVNGITLYLYEGKFITETEALAKWGITLPGSSISYNTYTAQDIKNLANNYQISLYDDNRDGKFDRATVASLFMSVYNVNGDGKAQFGIAGLKDEKVTFTNTDLKKGDIFTYTYNPYTKVVNVVEVLEIKTGVLSKINTTNANQNDATKSTYKSVVVTIDGKDYVLAKPERVAAGYVGANVEYTEGANFADLKKDAKMSPVDWTKLVIGAKVEFVVYGDNTIIAGYAPKAADPYKVVVAKEITDYSADSLTVSYYVDGIVKNDVEVSSVTIGETTYTFSKLNMFAFSETVNMLNSQYFKKNTFFQVRDNEDGTVSLTLTNYKDEYKEFIRSNDKLTFTAGIADTLTDTNDKDANAIRTNSATVFYFLGKDNSIKTFVGSPADNKYIDLSNVSYIYTDKLGYGKNSTNGISGVVIVDCGDRVITDTAVTNFFETATAPTTTVFLLKDSACTYVKATAETFGLSGTDVYRAYSVDAINLADGSQITTIYVKDSVDLTPKAGQAYTIKTATKTIDKASEAAVADGVVKTLEVTDNSKFVPARLWSIDGVKETGIANVKLTDYAKYDLKTNEPEKVLKDGKVYNVNYVIVGKDNNKTLIGVAEETVRPAAQKTVKITATNFIVTNHDSVTVVAKIGNDVVATKTITKNGVSDFVFDARVDWVGVSGNGTFEWTDTENYSAATVTP